MGHLKRVAGKKKKNIYIYIYIYKWCIRGYKFHGHVVLKRNVVENCGRKDENVNTHTVHVVINLYKTTLSNI